METFSPANGDRSRQKYAGALRRAAWSRFASRIRPRCNDLIPAAGLFQVLDLGQRIDLGLQEVLLDSITGSAGRHQDFDLDFNPRHRGSEARWTSIAAAFEAGLSLPPIRLYKIGGAHLVMDGHHRISVARALGWPTLLAWVVEIDPAPLVPTGSCERLELQHPGRKHRC